MKNLSFITITILFGFSSLCAQQNFNADIAKKSEVHLLVNGHVFHPHQSPTHSLSQTKGSGKGMRNTGAVLTVSGLAIAVTGLGLAASGDNGNIINTNLIAGLSLLPIGMGLIIPGGILWGKGNQKYRNSKGLSLHSNGSSLGVSYRF